MSQAEDLLNSLSVTYEAGTTPNESHIVIGRDRYIIVPDELKKIAVQNDHNIETVTFDCPRYWDQHDMSKMRIYVNYMRSDDEKGADLATNVVVDENDESIMHFDWTITGHMTALYGPVTILVCIQKVNEEDGTEQNHWNSELNTDMYVSEGMECEADVVAHYPGIITSLLARMDEVEELTTRESILSLVELYLTENSPTWIEIFFSSEQMMSIVEDYLNENGVKAGLTLVVGPSEPAGECLWFDTSGYESSTEESTPSQITLTDVTTDETYKLYVENGNLTMDEATETDDASNYVTTPLSLEDVGTNEVYKLYVENGKLTMTEVE